MPRKVPEMSPVSVRRLARNGLHAVGGVAGLHLYVKPSGSRSWVLRVMVGNRRRDIGLGGYPDVSLERARERAREMRSQIQDGIDPVAAKKEAKEALIAADLKRMTFDQAATICWRAKSQEFKSKHAAQWKSTLDRYASPIVGSLQVSEIEMPHVLSVLQPIWNTKTETATRVRGRMEAVLSWATVSGYREGENPARWQGNLEHALPKPAKLRKVQHFRALPWQQMGVFMQDLRKREGVGARALEFAILTAARSGEVRFAIWSEIDVPNKLWTIPGERMKAGREHKVPLSRAALTLLQALPHFENSEYLFPAPRGGVLSDMSVSAVTKRMNVDAVPHGFRSTFKDWARSSTGFPDEVSELALAHVNSDATRAAYARDELLSKRARLMDEWARFCGLVPQQGAIIGMNSR